MPEEAKHTPTPVAWRRRCKFKWFYRQSPPPQGEDGWIALYDEFELATLRTKLERAEKAFGNIAMLVAIPDNPRDHEVKGIARTALSSIRGEQPEGAEPDFLSQALNEGDGVYRP